MTRGFSQHVVYVDEAGDHGPASSEFPVFVLAFCIFLKADYSHRVLPAFHSLKFKYFGHDAVVFHEREIRKRIDSFSFLRDAAVYPRFMDDLTGLVAATPFTLIAVVVDKRNNLLDRNPYDLALDTGLVQVTKYLRDRADCGLTHVVVESRGKKENRELRVAFDAFCSPDGSLDGCNLELVFADKAHNHNGMQLADLIARPIGRHVMNPAQPNRAYEVLATKLWNPESPLSSGLHVL